MRALIIVDMQNDFLPGGNLPVPEGNEIIPVVNNLQHQYDLVIATQDWHPTNHQSFASQHAGKAVFDRIELHGLPQVLWPDHCAQNSTGAKITPELNTTKIAAIFRKGMDRQVDSYSGFYDNGRRNRTGLTGYLREKEVKEVHICGLAADFCVFYTAMDSLEEGFRTSILLNATKPIDVRSFEEKKQLFKEKGGQLFTEI